MTKRQPPTWTDGGRARGPHAPEGRARAPPAPPCGGHGLSSPKPNRPVPAFGGTPGLLPRSYAAATLGGIAKQRPTSMKSPSTGLRVDQSLKRSTNPDFGPLVRRIYAIIKVIHHQFQVDEEFTDSTPPIISRTVKKLATMINPAIPDSDVLEEILTNAQEWGRKTKDALARHYEKVLTNLVYDLPSISTIDWKTAFQIATGWARKSLPRITKQVISFAEGQIRTECGADDSVESVPNPPSDDELLLSEAPLRKENGDDNDKTNVKQDGLATHCKEATKARKKKPKKAADVASSKEDAEWFELAESTPAGRYLESMKGSMSYKRAIQSPKRDDWLGTREAWMERQAEDSGFLEMTEAQNEAPSPLLNKTIEAQKKACSSHSRKYAYSRDQDNRSSSGGGVGSSNDEDTPFQRPNNRRKRVNLT